MIKKLFLLLTLFFTVVTINAQVCTNLDAGNDVIYCNGEPEVTLNATVIAPNYKTTRRYTVGEELLCPPVTYDGSRTFIQTDDEWSDFVIDMPFSFCFYENQYDQMLISGNGIITFDLTMINQFSGWDTEPGDLLGTNGQQNWQTNAIFGAYHDMDSRVQPREDRISYKTIGETPNRKFIVSFECWQYSCNNLLSKSQIILYESSNVIDIRIDEKPICSDWNEGLAVVGIQNKSGTLSQTGREHGQWIPAAGGELWRFLPNGEDLAYTLVWYNDTLDPNHLEPLTSNNEESIVVSPDVSTTYAVEMILEDQCNDATATVVDTVVVSPLSTNFFECEDPIDSGTADFNLDQPNLILNGLDITLYNLSFYTSLDDANNDVNPIPTVDLNPYNSATTTIYYRIEEVAYPTNFFICSLKLNVQTIQDTSFIYDNTTYCSNEQNPLPNAVVNEASYIISNGGVINLVTGEIDLTLSGLGNDGSGVFEIIHDINMCSLTSNFTITIVIGPEATFDYPSIACISAINPEPISVTNAGGVFTVDGGAIIDSVTGVLDLATTTVATIYTITYTINDPNCPASEQQTVEILDDDASFSYADTQYCSDEVSSLEPITAVVGGVFTIDNGGVIDPVTGVINITASGLGNDGSGNFTVTYTIEACNTETQTLIVIEQVKDATFTYPSTEVCIEDINPIPTSITTAGGTFTVSPIATINSTTGELDLTTTTAGTTYTITYEFIGNCPSSTQQTINVVAQDDSSFDYPTALYCNNDTNPVAQNIITPGGLFSINNGGVLINTSTGEIDLAASGLGNDNLGVFIVTYTTEEPCSTMTDFEITIELVNDATFVYPSEVCIEDTNPTPISITTAGGTFTVSPTAIIDVNGELDLASTTAGTTYTITYEFTGNCPSNTQQIINVVAEDDATFTYSKNLYCVDETNPIPTPNQGGTFSINNNGVINPATGEINLIDSGLGQNNGNYTITFTTDEPCSNSSTFPITIELINDAGFEYVSEICQADINPVATNIITAGGTFTVEPTAQINATTGELILTSTTQGETYTITYNLSGNCPSNTTHSIFINESPIANLPTTILTSCDNGDTTANFDINLLDSEIIGNQNNVVVTYHIGYTNAINNVSNITTVPFAVLTGQNIWARVENAQGCVSVVNISDNIVVEVCFLIIPEIFSPNSNIDENQNFAISEIRHNYPNYQIWVFNRYGNEVYYGNAATPDWNGKQDNTGSELPAGTYYYGIKLNDNQDITHRGWVYLQR